MAAIERRYDKEEFARRGDAIYENDIRPRLKAGMKANSQPSTLSLAHTILPKTSLTRVIDCVRAFLRFRHGW
jgi:hypothetical protein